MKARILVTAFAVLACRTASADISGQITTVQQIYPGYTEYGTAYWYSASASYINGGVTFTFPTDLFYQNPTVIVSVTSDTYSASGTLTPLITQLDTQTVTVRVNVGTLSAIGEAITDSVTVHVWAIGTQN